MVLLTTSYFQGTLEPLQACWVPVHLLLSVITLGRIPCLCPFLLRSICHITEGLSFFSWNSRTDRVIPLFKNLGKLNISIQIPNWKFTFNEFQVPETPSNWPPVTFLSSSLHRPRVPHSNPSHLSASSLSSQHCHTAKFPCAVFQPRKRLATFSIYKSVITHLGSCLNVSYYGLSTPIILHVELHASNPLGTFNIIFSFLPCKIATVCRAHLLEYEGWLCRHEPQGTPCWKGPYPCLNAMLSPITFLKILRIFRQVAPHFHFAWVQHTL